MSSKQNYELKPLFVERMQDLLGEDFKDYLKAFEKTPLKSIRVNTLKISVEDLTKRLEAKGWKIKQISKSHPEIILIESQLQPGELGRTLEHMIGYYYVQDISSMLPVLALEPKENEMILDLCASPGSKTTQIAAKMKNTGTIIANELSLGRIKILAANTERCGVTNAIITKKEGFALCKRLKEAGMQFDRILVDAPCSGEGTMISKPRTIKMWNIRTVLTLSKVQKSLLSAAIEILAPKGTIIYSTCTHSPEENERVVDYVLRNNPNIKIEKIALPVKFRQGLQNWRDEEYFEDLKHSCRIYPQDNDTEGFFIAKLKKIK